VIGEDALERGFGLGRMARQPRDVGEREQVLDAEAAGLAPDPGGPECGERFVVAAAPGQLAPS
jgi:hypothetical protein